MTILPDAVVRARGRAALLLARFPPAAPILAMVLLLHPAVAPGADPDTGRGEIQQRDEVDLSTEEGDDALFGNDDLMDGDLFTSDVADDSAAIRDTEVEAAAQGQTPTNDEPSEARSDPLEVETPSDPSAPSEGIEQIVIQGTQTGPAIAETTTSSVAFDTNELEALGVDDISDLDRVVPNLEIVTLSATTPTFFIRGIGLNDFNANAPGAIAVYRDGVPINSPPIQLGKLFDLSGVEILRGPQGHNRFRNASGGVIAVESLRPSGGHAGSFRADFGNYRFRDFEGALELPLIADVLASRFAFRVTERDGYVDNRCAGQTDTQPTLFMNGAVVCGERSARRADLGDVFIDPGIPDEVNGEDNWATRGTLVFMPPGRDMEWTLSGHYSNIRQDATLGQILGTDDTGAGPATVQGYVDKDLQGLFGRQSDRFGVSEPGVPIVERLRRRARAARATLSKVTRDIAQADPFDNDYNLIGAEDLDAYGGFLEGVFAFERFDLRSITGGETYERAQRTDFDMSPNPSIHLDVRNEAWQVSQSLDLEGKMDALPLEWRGGVFYLVESLDSDTVFDLRRSVGARVPIFQTYEQDLHSGGVYANLSWDVLDDFTLDAGARFNLEYKTFDLTVNSLGRKGGGDDQELWLAPTGNVGITWHASEELSLFGKYTRGWKPGHFNASVLELGQAAADTFAADITLADPETIDSFELGMNATWWDGRVSARAAAFYYRYADYQVFLLANAAGSAPQFEVVNANDAEVYGAELDLDLEPVDGLRMSARLGWLESQFLDFTDLRSERVTVPPASFVKSVVADFTGNRLPNTPEFKASASLEYDCDLGAFGTLTPRYDMSYTTRVFYDPSEGRGVPALTVGQIPLSSNAIAQPAYILHNARLTWNSASEVVSLALWVRNFTDERYKTYVADASVGFSSLLNFIGEPRTFGGSVSVSY